MTNSPLLPRREWATLQSELVWIYDRPPGSPEGASNRERRNWAWLLRRGSAVLGQPDRGVETELRPGQWMLLPGGRTRHRFSADAVLLSVHFRCEWPSGRSLLDCAEPVRFPAAEFPQLEELALRLKGLVVETGDYKIQGTHESDGATFLELQAAFTMWLAAWLRACVAHGAAITRLGTRDDRVLHGLRLLNQAPLERPFPRAGLRKELGLSEVHLNRLFLRELGLTTRKYWDRRRLDFARACLEAGPMPVKELAFRLGFRTDSHFAVWFKRQAGQRPGEFREAAAGRERE